MSTDLGPALHSLTTAQPAQPLDRLGAVTRKARRIRRTRAALSVAAVLAVAAPLSLLLSEQAPDRAAERVAADPVTRWPDRSTSTDLPVAEGALVQWVSEEGHSLDDLRWLYRGPVTVPGGAPLYVAAWVADGQVVMGWVQRDKVDDTGQAHDSTGVNRWFLDAQPAETAPRHLGAYLPRLDAEILDDNYLFALADPDARELRWRSSPLPFAPTSGDVKTEGGLTSENGVFQGWTGTVTGPLTVAFDERFSLPGGFTPFPFTSSEVRLARVAEPDVPAGAVGVDGISGGAGQLGTEEQSANFTSDISRTASQVYIRCYGGGQVQVHVNDAVVGRVPCDASNGVVDLTRTGPSVLLSLHGDRFQVYAFRHVRAAR